MNDFSSVKYIFVGNVHSGEQFSFLMNLASEQMDVPYSNDIIINIMQPNVFQNMIVPVMVGSWCGQRFTTMVVLPW